MDLFKRLIPLLLAFTLMLGLGAYWLLYYTGNNTEFAKGHRYLVTIKPGMTTADIADLLHKKHLVKTPEAFRMEARLRGLAGKLEEKEMTAWFMSYKNRNIGFKDELTFL